MNRAIANQRVNLYGIAPEADYKDYLLNEFYYSINRDTVKTGSYSIPISKFNALVNGKIIFLKETREEQPMANNLPAVKTECAVISITPKEQIEQASEMSRLLKDIVTKAGLSRKLGGTKEHLDYEAWATIARWHHCTPSTEWTRPIKNGDEIIGWEARVNVLDDQGRVIGSSEGMCMADEKNWNGKPSYALRSMAQTRTAGKALRSLFAHVAVLAGYSPTPAEEMDGVDNRNHTEAKYTPPPSAPPKPKFNGGTKKQIEQLEELYKGTYGKMDVNHFAWVITKHREGDKISYTECQDLIENWQAKLDKLEADEAQGEAANA